MLLRSVLEVPYPMATPTVLAVHEPEPPAPHRPRLLDRVRMALRARHGSRRTERAYVGWIRRYILFHDKRHPAEMGATEVTQFLSGLALEKNVAASTQNQALSALLFLYDYALALMKGLPYNQWRIRDPEDSIRFYALRLHEAAMVKTSPQKLIAQGTDWRFLNELKKELKG